MFRHWILMRIRLGWHACVLIVNMAYNADDCIWVVWLYYRILGHQTHILQTGSNKTTALARQIDIT